MSGVNRRVTLSMDVCPAVTSTGQPMASRCPTSMALPSSHIEWQMSSGEPLATQLNLRVISMDRPGMSTYE